MTQATIDTWFNRLEIVLKGRKLPCEFGPARECTPGEFMLMNAEGETGAFKHKVTRNYVFVRASEGCSLGLHVPISTEPFYIGFFDDYDWDDSAIDLEETK